MYKIVNSVVEGFFGCKVMNRGIVGVISIYKVIGFVMKLWIKIIFFDCRG